MDLFTNFLDVGVHHFSTVEFWCSKNIFIHRTPEKHTRPSLSTFKAKYNISLLTRSNLEPKEHAGHTYIRTLCLPMTKDTLRLQGLTKLDQLLSTVMYSPFLAQKRIEE